MSEPGRSLMRWMLGGLAVIGIILLLLASRGHAHDWYSGTRDPSDGYGCCGGHDCGIINPRWIHAADGGVRVVMTVEQARTINPAATEPVDAFVPENRI